MHQRMMICDHSPAFQGWVKGHPKCKSPVRDDRMVLSSRTGLCGGHAHGGRAQAPLKRRAIVKIPPVFADGHRSRRPGGRCRPGHRAATARHPPIFQLNRMDCFIRRVLQQVFHQISRPVVLRNIMSPRQKTKFHNFVTAPKAENMLGFVFFFPPFRPVVQWSAFQSRPARFHRRIIRQA